MTEMAPDNDTPDRERQVVALLRAAQSERAPESLHAQIRAMQERATATPRRRLQGWPAFNFIRLALPTTAAAAAALVLALGGSAGAPSIAQAAALATRAPTAPAPAADPSDPSKLLTAKMGTLHFPNWQSAGGWHAVGERHDKVGNRTATTVYYATGSSRVVYSIVSSPTLHMKPDTVVLPSSPLQTQYGATMWHHGRATVVWEEAGHTCLLTGSRGMSAAKLWQLASFGFRKPLG